MPFPWMHAEIPDAFRQGIPARRLEMIRDEVKHRAGLLLRLGRSQPEAVQACRSYLKWEFAGMNEPPVLAEVDSLVGAVYTRARGSAG